jgi:predicted phage replisome organizer
MSDVKWIKIVTDIFDDEKILLIETLPEADSIIVIWFKLLCLAGKQNNSGVFLMNENIPYTDEMLASIFRRKKTTVQLALSTFEKFGMIEIINGVLTIPNWGKHQNIEQIEKRKEYMKNYMKEYRDNQKQLANGLADSVTGDKHLRKHLRKYTRKQNVNRVDKIREDKNRIERGERARAHEGDKTPSTPPVKTEEIKNLFNSIVTNLPKVTVLSANRKKTINARLKDYDIETITKVFEKTQESNFLSGKNDRTWKASFDWVIKSENFVKILEGNYDNREKGYEYDNTFEPGDSL